MPKPPFLPSKGHKLIESETPVALKHRKPKEPKLLKLELRVRRNVQHGDLCNVWLSYREQKARSCLLTGMLHEEMAMLLANTLKTLGVPLTIDVLDMKCFDESMEQQAERTARGAISYNGKSIVDSLEDSP